MAITINWGQRIINVPKEDLLLVQSNPTEIRELNLNTFRLALKNLEDSEEGITYPITHNHNTEVTVGGVTLARVIEIINDYTITFENGQYAVNLINANSNVGDRVNVNQVSVRSSNSAGLTQIREIEFSSYQGVVSVDQTTGMYGTTFPIGTYMQPSNNIADAKFIASLRGLEILIFRGVVNLIAGDNLAGYTLKGTNAITTVVTVAQEAIVDNCQFEDMFIHNSSMDGYTYLKHCAVGNISAFEGYMEDCMMSGSISLTSSGSNSSYFIDCKSGCIGLGAADLPILSMAGNSRHVAFRNFAGPIKIINSVDIDNSICLDISSGAEIIIDSSCTAGTIYIRGIASITNSSTMLVYTDAMLDLSSISSSTWSNSKALTIPKFLGLK